MPIVLPPLAWSCGVVGDKFGFFRQARRRRAPSSSAIATTTTPTLDAQQGLRANALLPASTSACCFIDGADDFGHFVESIDCRRGPSSVARPSPALRRQVLLARAASYLIDDDTLTNKSADHNDDRRRGASPSALWASNYDSASRVVLKWRRQQVDSRRRRQVRQPLRSPTP